MAQALGVSKGALSPALGYLVRLHLVERFRRPGERADRYTVRPGAWRRILEEQARMLGRFRELAERGLALVGENPRLREVRDLYAFLESGVSPPARQAGGRMTLLGLAWRNLLRTPGRSLTTGCAGV